jgi:hypothetical protein
MQIELYIKYKNRANETVIAICDDGDDAPEYKRYQIYNIDRNTHHYVSITGQQIGNLLPSPCDIMYEI